MQALSGKKIISLWAKSIVLEDLDAILITHEHSDHIHGQVLARKYGRPYANETAFLAGYGKIASTGKVDSSWSMIWKW